MSRQDKKLSLSRKSDTENRGKLVALFDNRCSLMINIHVQQKVDASPQQLLNELLDHVNLSRFFNMNFALVRQQNAGEVIGGTGAMRQVTMLGSRFVEEILFADETGIHYRIVGERPLKRHSGEISFTELAPLKTLIDYRISGVGPWFLPDALLQWIIARDIKRAMTKLAEIYL